VAGLRVEHIGLDGTGSDAGVVVKPSFNDTLVGGKLTLRARPQRHEIAFASVTRGYKAGGVNIDARIDVGVDPLTYATETLWNYEAGYRGHWRTSA